MLRWIGFLLVAVVLANVLGHVPLVGGFFRRTGVFGVWITALLVAWLVSWYGRKAVELRRTRAEIRSLGAVDTPHMRGKLGALHLAAGRAKLAKSHLEAAAEGEPDSLEWRYRLGLARLATGDLPGARGALEQVVAADPEYAYGQAQLRLAEVSTRVGGHERALEALDTFDRNHGPSPESAYRRGRALAAAGAEDEAARAYDEVGRLAKEAARFQRSDSFRWVAATWRARVFG